MTCSVVVIIIVRREFASYTDRPCNNIAHSLFWPGESGLRVPSDPQGPSPEACSRSPRDPNPNTPSMPSKPSNPARRYSLRVLVRLRGYVGTLWYGKLRLDHLFRPCASVAKSILPVCNLRIHRSSIPIRPLLLCLSATVYRPRAWSTVASVHSPSANERPESAGDPLQPERTRLGQPAKPRGTIIAWVCQAPSKEYRASLLYR